LTVEPFCVIVKQEFTVKRVTPKFLWRECLQERDDKGGVIVIEERVRN